MRARVTFLPPCRFPGISCTDFHHVSKTSSSQIQHFRRKTRGHDGEKRRGPFHVYAPHIHISRDNIFFFKLAIHSNHGGSFFGIKSKPTRVRKVFARPMCVD